MRTRKAGRPAQPLTGLLICGACGSPLHAGGGHNGGRRYPTYQCMVRGCGAVAVTSARIEAHVADQLFAELDEPTLASRLSSARSRATSGAAPGRRRLRTITERLERAERGYVEGLIPEARFRVMRSELLAEQAALTEAGPAVTPLLSRSAIARLRQVWDELTDDERRQAFRATVDRIVIPQQERRARRDLDTHNIEWRWS